MDKNGVDMEALNSITRTVVEHGTGELGERTHRLLLGDTLRRGIIPQESVDLTVTSPPYNVGKAYSGDDADDAVSYDEYLRFSKRWLQNCFLWTRPTGRLCVNVSIDKNKHGKQPLSADITTLAMKAGWQYHSTIVWNEGNISRRTAWGSWMSASAPHIIAPVEVIIVLYKGEWKRERQGASDTTKEEFLEWVLGHWTFNGENGKRLGHEAPFPRELPKRCIKLFSFKGDTVLDPFVGSGTTMIEAIANGRQAIGIEKEARYCSLTRKRVERECELALTESSPPKRGKSTVRSWEASLPTPVHTSLWAPDTPSTSDAMVAIPQSMAGS